MPSEELKPCPFCGCEEINIVYDGPYFVTIVGCSKCGGQVRGYGFRLSSRDEAVEKWNKRYVPPLDERALSIAAEAVERSASVWEGFAMLDAKTCVKAYLEEDAS